MTDISLNTELTPAGIVCSNATLGKVATIERKAGMWSVMPYAFPPYERTAAPFKSLRAAEYYVLALAHEMVER